TAPRKQDRSLATYLSSVATHQMSRSAPWIVKANHLALKGRRFGYPYFDAPELREVPSGADAGGAWPTRITKVLQPGPTDHMVAVETSRSRASWQVRGGTPQRYSLTGVSPGSWDCDPTEFRWEYVVVRPSEDVPWTPDALNRTRIFDHPERDKTPVTRGFGVELRGFEPLTP